MVESYTTTTTYNTIEEIQARKTVLLKDIQKDSSKIDAQWHSLFKKPAALSKTATPGQRLTSLVSTGSGFFDGLMLAWKLYRKFKR